MHSQNTAFFALSYLFLPFLKKAAASEPLPGGDEGPKCDLSELELYKQRYLVYKTILDRHAELIESKESKSIVELKTLIQPANPAVIKVRDGILAGFNGFEYERDFQATASKAFSFVKDEIRNFYMPVHFWLKPEEIVGLKLADEMDKSIFLCSLLIALGCKSAKVGVEVDGKAKRSFVFFDFNGETNFMDPARGVEIRGQKEEIFGKQLPGYKDKLLYDFNDAEYTQWETTAKEPD